MAGQLNHKNQSSEDRRLQGINKKKNRGALINIPHSSVILSSLLIMIIVLAYFPANAETTIHLANQDLSMGGVQEEFLPTSASTDLEFFDLSGQDLTLTSLPVAAPIAAFSFDPPGGDAPLPVMFRDESIGSPNTWEWTFGDGGTSTYQNPSYTYQSPGTYVVLLRVSNAGGYDTSSIPIVVSAVPTSLPQSVKPGILVTPTPTATPSPNPTKKPGIGSIITATPTPTPHPGIGALPTATQKPGSGIAYINPMLIPDEKNDSGSIKVPGTVVDPQTLQNTSPISDFTFVQGDGSQLMAVRFYDTSTGNPDRWEWDFGDGETSTEQNPVHEYPGAGAYLVFLDTLNSYGKDQKSAEIGVIDKPAQPEANFNAEPLSGPAPLKVQFTDRSAYGPTAYEWNFGDGFRSNLQNPIHIFKDKGSYFVSLDVSFISPYTKKEVSTSYIREITVHDPLKASFTVKPDEGPVPLTIQFTDTSVGNPIKWHWDFGDGTTSTDKNPSHTYSAHNSKGYQVKLTVSAEDWSDSAVSTIKTVPSIRPQAFFVAYKMSDTLPVMYNFEDRSAHAPTSWFWDFGDGNRSFEQYPVHRYHKEGNYTVNLTVGSAAGMSSYDKTVSVRVLRSI